MTNHHLPITEGTVRFAVKVVPRASRNEIVGMEGDALKIRLNAPPVEGKANDALIRVLADALGVSRSQIEIVTGHSSRRKIVQVRGVDAERVRQLIAKAK